MVLCAHTFWYPKDLEAVSSYEDSYYINTSQGIAAIADGVSSAMFSKQWADLLTWNFATNTPNIEETQSFLEWLNRLRSQWQQQLDQSGLSYFQKRKLADVGGGYATLLWAQVSEIDISALPQNEAAQFIVRFWALGDCCAFVVSNHEVVFKFPLADSSCFEQDPISVPSFASRHDDLINFVSAQHGCSEGDFVVLSSDAFAKWAYQRLERGKAIDWNSLWHSGPDAWRECIQTMRELPSEDRMRVDDTTVIMLRLKPLQRRGEITELVKDTSSSTVISPFTHEVVPSDVCTEVLRDSAMKSGMAPENGAPVDTKPDTPDVEIKQFMGGSDPDNSLLIVERINIDESDDKRSLLGLWPFWKQ